MSRAAVLEAALEAVNKRPKAYGPPEQNFERIGRLWTDHMLNRYGHSTSFDPVDVACMMALMKIARIEETPDHADSWIDLAGYAACGGEVSGAIEHDPDEHLERGMAEPEPQYRLEAAPVEREPIRSWGNDTAPSTAPRFKVGDEVRVYLTDGSTPADPVYEIRSVVTLEDGSPGYTIGRAGRPSGWVPWRESSLEPAAS